MDGKTLKWVHFGLVLFFLVLWAAAGIFGWLQSVTFVSHVSMVALVLAEVSSWQAARTEQKEDKNNGGDK